MATTGVNTNQIEDAAVTSPKIADLNVTGAKITSSAITTDKINPLAVTTAKIADGSVQTAKIADAQITEAKLVNGAVTNAKIGNAAVTGAKINNLAVSSGKLASNAVTEDKILTEAVTIGKIGSGAEPSDSVIISNGSGGAAWTASTGVGSQVLLVDRTFSASSSEAFTSSVITSDYKQYLIRLMDISVSLDDTGLNLAYSSDNGTTPVTSGYVRSGFGRKSNGSNITQESASAANINLCMAQGVNDAIGNASGERYEGEFTLSGLDASTAFLVRGTASWVQANGQFAFMTMGGYQINSSAINWIRIMPGQGVFSGRIKLYGIK